MHAIYYNRIEKISKIPPYSESFSLRCAYILCKQLSTAGDSFYYICFGKIFEQIKLEAKITILKGQDRPEIDEFSSLLTSISLSLKQYRKTKHPSSHDILFYKKMEKIVDTFWKEYMETNLSRFSRYGLSQLEVFVSKYEINILKISFDDPELDIENYNSTSKILMLDVENKKLKDFFFLPSIFFEEEYYKQLLPEQLPLYYEPVFTFPNIIGFEAEELKSLKLTCIKEATSFWEKFDEWYDICREGQPDKSKLFFYEEVFPLAKIFDEKLNDNPLFKHHYQSSPIKTKYEIVIGEIPLQTISAFYDRLGLITEKTKKELDKFRNNKFFENKRIPFIANLVDITNIIKEEPQFEGHQNESFYLISRKTLNID